MLTSWKRPDKESHFLIPELHISAHTIASITTPQINGLKSCRFHIFKHQILVVIFTFNDELDLNNVSALNLIAAGHSDLFEFFNFLINRLPP